MIVIAGNRLAAKVGVVTSRRIVAVFPIAQQTMIAPLGTGAPMIPAVMVPYAYRKHARAYL